MPGGEWRCWQQGAQNHVGTPAPHHTRAGEQTKALEARASELAHPRRQRASPAHRRGRPRRDPAQGPRRAEPRRTHARQGHRPNIDGRDAIEPNLRQTRGSTTVRIDGANRSQYEPLGAASWRTNVSRCAGLASYVACLRTRLRCARWPPRSLQLFLAPRAPTRVQLVHPAAASAWAASASQPFATISAIAAIRALVGLRRELLNDTTTKMQLQLSGLLTAHNARLVEAGHSTVCPVCAAEPGSAAQTDRNLRVSAGISGKMATAWRRPERYGTPAN